MIIAGHDKQPIIELPEVVKAVKDFMSLPTSHPYLWYEEDEGWLNCSQPPVYYQGLDGAHWYCDENWTMISITVHALPKPKHKTVLVTTRSTLDEFRTASFSTKDLR